MITSQTVYWITRLDPIHCLLKASLTAAFFLGALSFIITVGSYTESTACSTPKEAREAAAAMYRSSVLWLRVSIGAIVTLATLRVFVPTTKEAAAILTIPAAHETIVPEARELYELTKDWLMEKVKGTIKE